MTEVALYEAHGPVDPTGGRLTAWASSLTAAHKIGTALCNTSFVPATFKGKPEEAAAAILFGDEIGLTPTQALQSVYVISGKPALYARAMVAIVLSAGHEIETMTKTDNEVSVRGRRRGSETWTVETWTTERAKRAGYLNNKKYATDPQSMLYARAASDLCRQIAPDALAGIGYSVEELEAEPAKVTITREPKSEGQRAIKRNAPPEPVEPTFEEPPASVDAETGEIVDAEIVEDAAPVEVETITDAQMRKMRVLLGNVGMKDREQVLTYVRGVVGHEVESSKTLTRDEASKVIEALTELETLATTPEPPLDDE
jgi:hypothetical protein